MRCDFCIAIHSISGELLEVSHHSVILQTWTGESAWCQAWCWALGIEIGVNTLLPCSMTVHSQVTAWCRGTHRGSRQREAPQSGQESMEGGLRGDFPEEVVPKHDCEGRGHYKLFLTWKTQNKQLINAFPLITWRFCTQGASAHWVASLAFTPLTCPTSSMASHVCGHKSQTWDCSPHPLAIQAVYLLKDIFPSPWITQQLP